MIAAMGGDPREVLPERRKAPRAETGPYCVHCGKLATGPGKKWCQSLLHGRKP